MQGAVSPYLVSQRVHFLYEYPGGDVR
jgi:hypothetical protein